MLPLSLPPWSRLVELISNSKEGTDPCVEDWQRSLLAALRRLASRAKGRLDLAIGTDHNLPVWRSKPTPTDINHPRLVFDTRKSLGALLTTRLSTQVNAKIAHCVGKLYNYPFLRVPPISPGPISPQPTHLKLRWRNEIARKEKPG